LGFEPALTPSALFGGTALIEDEHCQSGDAAELALHQVELAAMPQLDRSGQTGRGEFLRSLTDDHDLLGAFRPHLLNDRGDLRMAFHLLSAGHRDGVVELYVVVECDPRCRGGAQREQPAVLIGAVTEILEDMSLGEERTLPDPGR